MHRFKDRLESYMKACYGDKTLSDVQRQEVEQAFVGGALCAVVTIMSLSDFAEDEAEKALDALFHEIKQMALGRIDLNIGKQAGRN